jgi:hypothetical protein
LVRCASAHAPTLTSRPGDDEHAGFYCGDELEGDNDARAAALERFDAILQIDAGRFADDDDEEEEEEDGSGAGMAS